MGPDVSVVLATYNGARHIGEQLRSLYAQTLRPSELIVTDDQSQDDTLGMIKEFAQTAPFPVHVSVNPARLGYGCNFMHAAAKSSGTYVAFCDQDDIWSPNKLEACIERLQSANALTVFHNATVFSDNRHSIRTAYRNLPSAQVQPMDRGIWFSALGFTIVFDRRLLALSNLWQRTERYGFPLSRMAHDQWISFLGNALASTEYIDLSLARYRMHEGNASLRPNSRWVNQMRNIAGPDIAIENSIRFTKHLVDVLDDPTVETLPNHVLLAATRDLLDRARCNFELRKTVYVGTDFASRLRSFGRLAVGGHYGSSSPAEFSRLAACKDFLLGVLGAQRATRLGRYQPS